MLLFGALAALLGVAATACEDNDLGRCCSVIASLDGSVIPQPDKTDAGSYVSQDPALNCDDLSCISYQGSQPYCTRPCTPNSKCPSGFTCEKVFHASAGPDAGVDSYFCVKQGLSMCMK